jgi:hypothetical protein
MSTKIVILTKARETTMRRLLLGITLLACAVGFARAQADVAADRLTEDVLQRSGAKRQIESIPEAMELQLAQRENESDPQLFSQISLIFRESYRAEVLYKAVFDHFKKNFDKDRMLALQQWLHSPLSQKITELEIHSSSSEGRAERVKFIKTFRYLSKPPQRLALIQRLDRATRSSTAAEDIAVATALSMMQAVNSVLPLEKQVDPEVLKKFPAELRTRVHETIQQTMLMSFYYTYKGLSDEELEQYVRFYESELGTWASQRWTQAMTSALAAAAENASQKLARSLASMKRG